MSLRFRTRSDGSTYTQVRFRIHGKETSVSFNDHAEALQFDDLIAKVGPAKAIEITRIVIAHDRALTLGQWLDHHNNHLTGVDEATVVKYKSYAANDFGALVDIHVRLSPADRLVVQIANRDGGFMPDVGQPVAVGWNVASAQLFND